MVPRNGFGSQSNFCAQSNVLMQQCAKIHPVQLVAA
jgi:hypothetical protein